MKVDVFGPGGYSALMNRRIKPMDDVRVREAVARAVNVQKLVRSVGGDVAMAGRSVVPSGYAGEANVAQVHS